MLIGFAYSLYDVYIYNNDKMYSLDQNILTICYIIYLSYVLINIYFQSSSFIIYLIYNDYHLMGWYA